jgi:hypothetical protein
MHSGSTGPILQEDGECANVFYGHQQGFGSVHLGSWGTQGDRQGAVKA